MHIHIHWIPIFLGVNMDDTVLSVCLLLVVCASSFYDIGIAKETQASFQVMGPMK